MLKLLLYLLPLYFAIHAAQALELVADYSGTSFFDKWNFSGFYDNLTSGMSIIQSGRIAILNELFRRCYLWECLKSPRNPTWPVWLSFN